MLNNWHDKVKEDFKDFKGEWITQHSSLILNHKWYSKDNLVHTSRYMFRAKLIGWKTPFVAIYKINLSIYSNNVPIDGDLPEKVITTVILNVLENTNKNFDELTDGLMGNYMTTGIDITFKPDYDNLYRIMNSNYRSHGINNKVELTDGTEVLLAEAQLWEKEVNNGNN